MLTVSIVEDTRTIRERLAARVAEMPDVRLLSTHASAEEALEELPRLQPALTIMDIGLPKMSGTELLATLVSRDFAGEVIMFTVFDHDEHLFRALELGARGYVLKEERAAGVVAAIELYRAGGAPMSPAIARRVLSSFRQNPSAASTDDQLTEQQQRILALIAEGLQNKEIAVRLELSEGTIKQHIHRIYRKLSINNRAEAVRYYLRKHS